jgi:hypothetical protein
MHRQKYFTEFAWREAGAAPESIKNGESAPSDSRRARSPQREIFRRRARRFRFALENFLAHEFARANYIALQNRTRARQSVRCVRARVSFSRDR